MPLEKFPKVLPDPKGKKRPKPGRKPPARPPLKEPPVHKYTNKK